jgi:hypothetical protein
MFVAVRVFEGVGVACLAFGSLGAGLQGFGPGFHLAVRIVWNAGIAGEDFDTASRAEQGVGRASFLAVFEVVVGYSAGGGGFGKCSRLGCPGCSGGGCSFDGWFGRIVACGPGSNELILRGMFVVYLSNNCVCCR